MNNLIFTYEGYENTNIGDYIQSLAAKQFYPDYEPIIYAHRDELNGVTSESRAIMNGWFTHKPENWPCATRRISIYKGLATFHIRCSRNCQ